MRKLTMILAAIGMISFAACSEATEEATSTEEVTTEEGVSAGEVMEEEEVEGDEATEE